MECVHLLSVILRETTHVIQGSHSQRWTLPRRSSAAVSVCCVRPFAAMAWSSPTIPFYMRSSPYAQSCVVLIPKSRLERLHNIRWQNVNSWVRGVRACVCVSWNDRVSLWWWMVSVSHRKVKVQEVWNEIRNRYVSFNDIELLQWYIYSQWKIQMKWMCIQQKLNISY